MRIGIDCRMYGSSFTGIGRYCYELVNRLISQDQVNTYVLFFNEPEYSSFPDTYSNVEKVLVNAKHYTLAEQWKFLQILNKSKLDVMHFTHFNAPMLYRGRSVVTIHDLTLSLFPGKKMRRWWHRVAYNLVIKSITRKSTHIIAVTKHTKKDLEHILKIPSQKVAVIYEGVADNFHANYTDADTKRIKEQYKTGERYLMYSGVWRSHKNVVGLIKAFRILKDKHNYPGKLVITGKPNPYYPEVTNTVKELALENEVLFVGHVSEKDLISLLQAAESYVFPSFYEGFGLPPLEAFACNTPVVASNASCIPEVCGEAAIFFDPNNIEEMADKVNEVVTNEDLKKQLVEKGNHRLHAFDWDTMVAHTKQIYEVN